MYPIAKRLLAVSIAMSLAACADAATTTAADTPDTVKAAIQKKFPGRNVDAVRTTPVKGIYEVNFQGRQVIYTDAHADYIFVGDLIDVKSHLSLTEARVKELSKTDFTALPFEKAIKVVRGNGTRKVAVFSDPDCPFCKKIEHETLSKLDDVTIYTFMLPLTQLHPDAPRKASLIWCAGDKVKAWQDWMFEGKLPDGNSQCPTPGDDIAKLAEKLGVNGTPAMVFENGELVSGAIPLEDFKAHLVAKKL